MWRGQVLRAQFAGDCCRKRDNVVAQVRHFPERCVAVARVQTGWDVQVVKHGSASEYSTSRGPDQLERESVSAVSRDDHRVRHARQGPSNFTSEATGSDSSNRRDVVLSSDQRTEFNYCVQVIRSKSEPTKDIFGTYSSIERTPGHVHLVWDNCTCRVKTLARLVQATFCSNTPLQSNMSAGARMAPHCLRVPQSAALPGSAAWHRCTP